LKSRRGGVIGAELSSNALNRGFVPRSGQTKDYTIDISVFARKNKDWLGRSQDNLSEGCDISTVNQSLFFLAKTDISIV
jgi:hypothetical protein